MNIHEGSWTSPDGVTFYTRSWKPDGPPRAVVVLVHGLGEHCARYDHVAAAFAEAGIAMASFDHRGHGRSEGKRGHIPSFDLVNADIEHFLNAAGAEHPGLPVFLYGHSMGGLMVLYYAFKRRPEIRGVIASAPALGLGAPQPAAKVFLLKALSSLAPSLTISNGLDVNNLSHDPEVIKAYTSDPLVTTQISASLAMGLIQNGEWSLAHASELGLPLLLIQGSEDHLVSVEATRKFAAAAPQNLTTYREWDGLYHEVHNEFDQDAVLSVVLDWVEEQVNR